MSDSSQDPFTATWSLVSWRSQPALPAPQNWIHQIEASAETIRVREEMLTAANLKTVITVHARFDGQDYPVSGSPQTDAIAYTRPSVGQILAIGKKGGRSIWREVASASDDGRSMTVEISWGEEAGQRVRIAAVFEKLSST